jgi:hypothetical protein
VQASWLLLLPSLPLLLPSLLLLLLLLLAPGVFTTNKRGYPILSKAHQELLSTAYRHNVQVCGRLRKCMGQHPLISLHSTCTCLSADYSTDVADRMQLTRSGVAVSIPQQTLPLVACRPL